ncbi:cyclic di-GMP phosphodiesterase Gmr [mine drainage metagenome]|uniref:Cyclic di-GMP phosphodiesterase Gmr n=1 Tax=mine drainage metagenome TaxID=410659 RepID=A0A1J5SJS3_9ZZZZ
MSAKSAIPLFSRNRWLSLLACLLAMFAGSVHAQPLLLTELPSGSLGGWTDLYVEEEQAPDLAAAQELLHEGKFHPVDRPILSQGIGSKPQWLHLALINPAVAPISLKLSVGTTWTDRIDAYLVHDGQPTVSWLTGDELPRAPGLTQGIGYILSPAFAPGRSDLFLRVDSTDPLIFPIELLTEEQAKEQQQLVHYSYGFIFGFMMALAAYNATLFFGLRKRSHLYYAVYLVSLVVLIACYTGHGFAWLWPDRPQVQRYAILVAMVIYGCCGLLFASRFLSLKEHAPRALGFVRLFAAAGLIAIATSILLDSQLAAALVAFNFAALFSLSMVLLGLLTIRNSQPSGRYFLIAAVFGMLGAGSTTLAVWGEIPFNTITYHALEIGMVIEATLFALALSYRFNEMSGSLAKINALNDQLSGEVAERKKMEEQIRQLAFHDTLTELPNRRLLLDRLEQTIAVSQRKNSYAALIFLDLDNFKPLNDMHGHVVGDLLLMEVARRLQSCVRESDTVARFGGDEFVVMLGDLGEGKSGSLTQARIVAEKILAAISGPYRFTLAQEGQTASDIEHYCTASIGVVVFTDHMGSPDDLIRWGDSAMYRAKMAGRNTIRFFESQD